MPTTLETESTTTKTERKKQVEGELNRLFPHRQIKKVLFVAPPDADKSMFHYSTGKRGRYWNYPPYGVGTIATHLRKLGIEVDILNLNYEVLRACYYSESEEKFDFDQVWQSKLKEKIYAFQPDLIGVTCMFTQTNLSAKLVCNEIKRNFPTTPLCIGGVHITNTFMSEETRAILLEDFSKVDLFFIYEAELAFAQFVKAVNQQVEADQLYQVYFQNGSNGSEKLYFPERIIPTAEDLNVIPAHDLITLPEIGKVGKIGSFYCLKEPDAKFTTVLSNRGCRAQCTFCSVRNFNGIGVRRRSIQSVIDELKMLRNDFGIDHIMWLDDDFLFDHASALELFNEMIRQKVGITWDCTNGVIAASCTEELIAAAEESGCLGLIIGMESGNREILKQIKKPGMPETFLKAAAVLRKHEQINARVFLMIGFPGETYQMILDTIHCAQEMDLDWYNITILQPLPNTPIFDSMVQQGLIKKIDFQNIRYNSGVYGKQRKLAEQKKDLLQPGFKDAFSLSNLDEIPPPEKLDLIWAYMNFHLNFKRLLKENRPTKLLQKYKYVKNIVDLVAPESGFAIYFCGYLQKKLYGKIEPNLIEKLRECLENSYWRDRFDEFGLALEHLKTGSFPDSPS